MPALIHCNGDYTIDIALDAIEALCDGAGGGEEQKLVIWTAADWFRSSSHHQLRQELGITHETTDAELKAIAARERESTGDDKQPNPRQ